MKLKGIYHPAMKMAYSSMKIQRSPKQAFIFLVGESGSGKSSTVNYLFNEEVAKVNKTESEQRFTTEYIVTMESKEWEIPDLSLSIVDTPGFGDTEGLEQDVNNFASIIAFRKQHPYLKGYFPNLVFLAMKVTENRIEGSSSKFSKILRTLNVLEIVDKKNPNIIVVLTHAAMLPRNQKKFEVKVMEMKKIVSRMVESFLEITPLIVIQENQPEDYYLEEEGDWHILPNKERQPRTLFTACKTILNLSQDELCHEAISVYFRSNERRKPNVGFSFDSSSLRPTQLQKIQGALLEPEFPSNSSEVSNLLDQYIKRKALPGIEFEIGKLKMRFKSFGIASAEQLQSMSMNQLKSKIKPTHISTCMEKILEDLFGMKYEQMCDLECGIGKGYNIFADNILHKTPYTLDDVETGKLGLPENISVYHCNYFDITCEEVEDHEQYVTERLKSLKIGSGPNINLNNFSMQVRGGYNMRQRSNYSSKSSKDEISFLIEQRLYKITVPNSISYTGEFISDVVDLPQQYEANDVSNVEKWKIFFSKWGHYIVTEMFLGGSVSGYIQTNEQIGMHEGKKCKNAKAKISAKLLSFQDLFDFARESDENNHNDDTLTFTSSSLQWIGGKGSPKSLSFESFENGDWDNWLESLEYKPSQLSTYPGLRPIYLLIEGIDKVKCVEVKKAMENEIFSQVSKHENQVNLT